MDWFMTNLTCSYGNVLWVRNDLLARVFGYSWNKGPFLWQTRPSVSDDWTTLTSADTLDAAKEACT